MYRKMTKSRGTPETTSQEVPSLSPAPDCRRRKTQPPGDTSPPARAVARPSAKHWRAEFCRGPKRASATHRRTRDKPSRSSSSPLNAPHPGFIAPNLLARHLVHPPVESGRESLAVPCHGHADRLVKRETWTPAKKLSGLTAIQLEVVSLMEGVLLRRCLPGPLAP